MYLSLIVSFILFIGLYLLKRKKVKFGTRVLLGMILGVGLGVVFGKDAGYIAPVGTIYANLIVMLVVPLVVPTVISSITAIESPGKLKNIGVKTVAWLLGTTAVACVIGIVVAVVMDPGSGIQFAKDASYKARNIPNFSNIILDMVPKNVISEMAEAKIIPVLVFSILIGVAITLEGEKNPEIVKPVKKFFDSFKVIMFRITDMVLELTPYGVLALLASTSAKYGASTLIPLLKVVIAVYIACIIQVVFVHGGLIAFVAKINPIRFFKGIYPAQVVAFTTRSSYGTLPVTIKSLTENIKISDNIASFSAPLGATMGMNGCGGLYPAIAAIFVARIFNIPMSFSTYILLIVVTTIASIGTAGVPGTASIMATVVFTALGLPIEGLGIIFGVDAIMDMARTLTNVTGASVVSVLVANSEGEFDREAFNAKYDKKKVLS
ncbi:dicarboxylate/amino acid:cation symporter [Clostridium sp. cel8]|jgi:uncharacterized protein|uniref:dicarboxylate/amino acid:cation symporter n=1 Tax=unclassified Clostridium TaxID=2614128 RepID=UPI0015F47BF2|nr:dicarboxylate/amino acid:cation symporter [Clostridium sp. cel8]MBA5850398.1 dicarboxylate/amino acid:cation symporter [Clostridium sp. cel8]